MYILAGVSTVFRAAQRGSCLAALRVPGAAGFSRTFLCQVNSPVKKAVRLSPSKLSASWNAGKCFPNLNIYLKKYTLFSAHSLTFAGIICVSGFVLKCKLSSANCGLKLSHKSSSLHSKHPKDENKEEEDQHPAPKFSFNEFFKFLWPDLWLLILASFSAFAVAVVNIQLPLLLGELVNVVSSLTTGEHANDYFQVLRLPALKLLSIYAMQSGLTFMYISLLSCLGERLAARIRNALFASLIRQDIAFFDEHKTGELVNRLSADVQDFKSAFKQVISQGLRSTTQTIGCVVTLYFISPKLTALLIPLLPVIIITGTLMGSGLRRLSRAAQEQFARATAIANEALGNVRTVRAFAMEDKETKLFFQEVEKSKSMNELLGVGIGVFQGLANLAINGLVLVVLYAGGSLLATNEIKPGDLISFLVATQTVQRSLANVSVLFGQTVRGLSAGARVFEYLLVKPSALISGGERVPCDDIRGKIIFKHVKFAYPTRKGQTVLSDFSLEIPAGKMVALCGPSGAGKSTVAALLERFYEVQEGSIELDGLDIKILDPTWMREKVIGYIHQEPILFANSVMENIRYGKPDATDEEVKKAAKQANADHFIRQFPKGYDTVLGERGVTVSGGQRQRIAIARALLKDPPVLILDEATSALDAESERVVQEALDRLTADRTVIVIAHRLSTIQGADMIVVLSHGNIKETGTHQELMKRQGLYAALVQRQTQEETED